jgi:Ran GTPase-activating protein (RanGAP) involved in mRNA processing and transport
VPDMSIQSSVSLTRSPPGNPLDNEAFVSLATHFPMLPLLEDVSLAGNSNINFTEGIEALAKVIPKMPALKVLNLKGLYYLRDRERERER